MALLTRDDLVNARPERVYRNAWLPPPDPKKCTQRVEVRLRSMYGGEHLALVNGITNDDAIKQADKWSAIRLRMVTFCWVDNAGRPVLGETDTQSDWWKRLHPAFQTALINEVSSLNGDQAGDDLEGELKNLPEIGELDSPTELPGTSA